MAQEPLMGQGLLIIEASWLRADNPPLIGLLWTNEKPDAETSTWQHATHTTERDIHAPCRIRTHNPNKRAATDSRLRQHGHWNRHFSFLTPKCFPHLFVLGHVQSVFSFQTRFWWQICFPIWGSTNKVLLHSGFLDVNSGCYAELNDFPPHPYERFPAVSLQQRGSLSSTTPSTRWFSR